MQPEDGDKEKINESLGTISRSVVILFIGTIIGTGLGFITRIIIIRNVTQAEYGIYSLCFTLISISVSIGLLGLNEGVTREISYYFRKDDTIIKKIINSSLIISVIVGFLLSLFIFIMAEPISTILFNEPGLIIPLRVFSIGVLFNVLLQMFISIYRGYDRTKEKVYFEDLVRPLVFLLLLITLYFINNFTLINVIFSYLFSIFIPILLFGFYTYKSKIKLEVGSFDLKISKSLLVFSLPLLGVSILSFVIHWTDTLMLGYFEPSNIVGLYGGIYPLANYMIISLYLFSYIYMPISSKLHADGFIKEMKRVFRITAKWMFFIVSPIFFLLFLFPGEVLELLFGVEYRPAATALRILIIGFMFHSLVGLTSRSLVAIGRTKLSLYGSIIGAIVNVILNATLIPIWSLEGAATASTLAFISLNISKTSMLYKVSKIHVFYSKYLKIITIFILLLIVFFPLTIYFELGYLGIVFIMIVYILAYICLIFLSKGLDKEDLELLLKVERRLEIDLSPVKSIMKRFI